METEIIAPDSAMHENRLSASISDGDAVDEIQADATGDETPLDDQPAEAGDDRSDGHESDNGAITPDQLATLIDEAEQRGYLRGCNESIERLMARPTVFQRCSESPAQRPATDEILILNNIRPSVWD